MRALSLDNSYYSLFIRVIQINRHHREWRMTMHNIYYYYYYHHQRLLHGMYYRVNHLQIFARAVSHRGGLAGVLLCLHYCVGWDLFGRIYT